MVDERKAAPSQQKSGAQKAPAAQAQKVSDAANIVRIAGRDIDGKYTIPAALRHIKGISHNLANAISLIVDRQFGITQTTTIGSLEDDKIAKLESVIKEPGKFGVPSFMLNRQKDYDTNTNMHFVGTDLLVKVKQDIDNTMKLETWVGYRRQSGQRVRGQRTRSTGRTGVTVGVTKKKIQEEAKKSKTPGKSGGGQANAPAAAAPSAAPAPAAK